MRTYAQQLSDEELQQLAAATAGLSGRDLRDIASRTERSFASKVCCKQCLCCFCSCSSMQRCDSRMSNPTSIKLLHGCPST